MTTPEVKIKYKNKPNNVKIKMSLQDAQLIMNLLTPLTVGTSLYYALDEVGFSSTVTLPYSRVSAEGYRELAKEYNEKKVVLNNTGERT